MLSDRFFTITNCSVYMYSSNNAVLAWAAVPHAAKSATIFIES